MLFAFAVATWVGSLSTVFSRSPLLVRIDIYLHRYARNMTRTSCDQSAYDLYMRWICFVFFWTILCSLSQPFDAFVRFTEDEFFGSQALFIERDAVSEMKHGFAVSGTDLFPALATEDEDYLHLVMITIFVRTAGEVIEYSHWLVVAETAETGESRYTIYQAYGAYGYLLTMQQFALARKSGTRTNPIRKKTLMERFCKWTLRLECCEQRFILFWIRKKKKQFA